MPFKTKALRRAQIIPSTTFIQIPLLDSSSDGVFWQKCVGHLDSSKGSTCYEFTYLLTHCQDSFIFLGVPPLASQAASDFSGFRFRCIVLARQKALCGRQLRCPYNSSRWRRIYTSFS